MPKPLIIAEKPSMARAIAEALGNHAKKDGYLEAGPYRITWAFGHLIQLADPEEYKAEYKKWRLSDLPIVPQDWKTRPRDADAAKQLKVIAALAQDAEYLVNACDAAREGELVYRYLAEFLHLDKKPTRRLWVSSLTPAAIKKAFQEMKPSTAYDNLHASALTRARGDWLVGMNATRLFTLKYRDVLDGVASIGRVQTPTLAMLVRREREIRQFKPEKYWEVLAGLNHERKFQAKWQDPKGNSRITTAEQAEEIGARVKQAGQAVVVDSRVEESKHAPPQLYDLTNLQREANKRFSMTAAQTLAAVQELYEAKLVTYPRTDSRYVTEDMAERFPALLKRLVELPAYSAFGDKVSPNRAMNKRVVDTAKVTDHHAILPTGSPPPASLGGSKAKIYDLIARRFLANCMPFAEDSKVTLKLKADAEWLVAAGTSEVKAGWREVERAPAKEKAEDEEANPVPPLPVGTVVKIMGVEVKERTTKPPARFTEGSLLSAMENAGREIDDDAMKEIMRGKGIGTPATRAAIIERLKEVGYIVAEKKTLAPTEKGQRIIELVERSGVDILTSPELTGEWEYRLNKVAEGDEQAFQLEAHLRLFTAEIVEKVRGTDAPSTFANSLNLPKCPLCQGELKTTYRTVSCSTAGCTLRFSRQILRHTLTAAEVEALLRKGRTGVIKGLISPRTNKKFAAVLVLKADGSGIDFKFEDVPKRRTGSARASSKTKRSS